MIWETVTSDLATLQPGSLTMRPSINTTWRMIHIAWCRTALHLCPVPAGRIYTSNMVYETPIYSALQDVAFSRCRRHLHTHATPSPSEPQNLLQEDTNCTSEMSYKIYYTCSFPLCIIKFFISSLEIYRPKYHYELVTKPSVNIIK